MRYSMVAAVAAFSLGASACSGGPDGPTRAESGTVIGAVAGGLLGNAAGRGGGRPAATIVGAVVGGIVGSEIGRSMDRQDRILARQAELDAFERGRSGEIVTWRNPDNGRYGEIVPEPAYRRGPQECRDYIHRVYIDGRPQALRGTACRNPDGTWSNVG